MEKSRSPFYPEMPVPPEEFVGRKDVIDRIRARGLGQVAAGRSYSLFLEGEYGFGKTSLAQYVMRLAAAPAEEGGYNLLPLYVSIGGCATREDLAQYVLRAATTLSGTWQALREFLGRFINQVTLFGVVSVNPSAVRETAPDLATPDALLGFLANLRRTSSTGGVVLVFDEINGVASSDWFSQFIKSLADTNSVQGYLPLLLVLCGTPDRRRQMIARHRPIERIWDPITVDAVDAADVREYLLKAFRSVEIRVADAALEMMTFYSGGHPRVMHIIGDVAFWQDKDGVIDEDDAIQALTDAADEVGRKFVDRQIVDELHSETYRSILAVVGQRILKRGFGEGFTRRDMLAQLADPRLERNFDNFVQRMRALGAIAVVARGEYRFSLPIIEAYVAMRAHPAE